MEALKAFGLPPFPLLAEKPKKTQSLAIISPLKNQSFSLSRTLHGSLVLLSSLLNTGIAKSLTYQEALQQTGITAPSDFDFAGAFDSVINFAAENPAVVGSGAAALVVPVVVSQLISKTRPWGVESAKVAYAKLGDDPNAQILDIRAAAELRLVGGPDVRGLKKKAAAVAYDGGDKAGFLKKLALKFKEPENTTLFVLDKFDGNSELVAELVTANGFKAAYAIKDGAEGPRGWMNSGLPWIPPKKLLSFDLSDLTDAFGEGSDAVPLTVGVAAAAGLGLLAFTEVEAVLQLLGSAALIQFVSKKLLFAEDRKQTIQQIEELLNTKVAPKELVDDIQEIGKALLPPTVVSKTLPAPAEGAPAPGNSAAVKSESTTETMKSESTAETNTVPPKAEPTPEVNSVPKAEVEQESLPVTPRPLSPYPNYPDFKPPSSPMPSQP